MQRFTDLIHGTILMKAREILANENSRQGLLPNISRLLSRDVRIIPVDVCACSNFKVF